jgi:hypothetical protein
MANRRTEVHPSWLENASTVDLRGRRVQILSPEELIWTKIYVLQRDRCDWPDLLNIIYAAGPGLDWERLLHELEADRPLLVGVLSVFSWLCPQRAGGFPAGLWSRLGLIQPEPGPACGEDRERVNFLDTRDWFGPSLPPGETLKA